MRRPRAIEDELAALSRRAALLKTRRLTQIGDLVVAVGADRLEPETLIGALLAAVQETSPEIRSGWRRQGEAFFRGETPSGTGGSAGGRRKAAPGDRASAPADRTNEA